MFQFCPSHRKNTNFLYSIRAGPGPEFKQHHRPFYSEGLTHMVWITEWVSVSSYMQPLAFSSNPCFSDSLSVLFLVPLNLGHYMDLVGCPPVFLSMWIFFFFCFDPQCSQSIPSLFHSSHSLERESDCLVLIEYLVMLCHSSEVTD